jgi:predicted permease
MFDDLKSAWRRLRHAPGFTAAAVFTLAVAIGANTALFSVADGVLFRPLPYADPDRIHIVQMRDPKTGQRFVQMPYAHLQTLSEHHQGLSDVGMLDQGPSVIADGPDGAERITVLNATANYFELLGARAARGRLLARADESSTGRPAVLTYALWQQRFGSDASIVGRTVTLGSTAFDVVGVLRDDFVFPSLWSARTALVTVMPSIGRKDKGGTFHPIVKREPGVTRERAQAELDALILPLVADGSSVPLPVLDDVRSVLYPTGRPIMSMLLAAAGLVLLLGCANLANLLLARSEQREKDTGIRLALGASRARLMRTLFFEALMIGAAGAAAALAMTSATFDLLLRQVPPTAYRNAPVGVSARVVVFALLLGLVSGVVFAALPAWRSARVDVQRLLQGRGGLRRERRKFGRPMIGVQVATAVVLVFGAAIAARALTAVLRVPLGFSPDNVVNVLAIPPNVSGRGLQAFFVRAMETLSQRADVVSVGAIGSMPMGNQAPDDGLVLGGERQRSAALFHVLPGYFETLQIPLKAGRLPNLDDLRSGAGVAVLSEAAARALFLDRDPLGATLANPRGHSFAVIGIVADVRQSFDADTQRPVYVIPHDSTRAMRIAVRTRARSDSSLAGITRDVSALAPATPVTVQWYTDSIGNLTAIRVPRFQTVVLGSFAALALLLTGTGVFGVVSFLIARRTREMGIRMAIGATPGSLVGLMVRQTLVPVGAGLIGGIAATRWVSRFAEAQLVKVDARDPWLLAAAAATVIVAALLAAYVPARRASRIDPIAVLRAE